MEPKFSDKIKPISCNDGFPLSTELLNLFQELKKDIGEPAVRSINEVTICCRDRCF